jgi:hypothetical protein
VFETIALGFGSNTIWIDPEHDLVVVWRWHRGTGNEFFRRLIAAVEAGEALDLLQEGFQALASALICLWFLSMHETVDAAL